MDPFAQNRKKLEQDLLDVVIAQASENKLTEDSARPIAQFVLDRIDKLQNQQQAVQFLEELCAQWPIFSSILEIEKGRINRGQEMVAAQNIAAMLKHGDTQQALAAAQKIMPGEKPQ